MLAVALLAVAAGVLIVTLGGARQSHRSRPALAATRSGPSEIQAAASYLGIDPRALRELLRGGETLEQVAQSTPGRSATGLLRALQSGRAAAEPRAHGLTPGEAQANEAHLRATLKISVRPRRRLTFALGPAARYLGLRSTAVRARLRDGRTLTEIAAARGRTRAQLIEAILNARRMRFDARVSEGEMRPAQERAALAEQRQRIAQAVDTRMD